MNKTLTDLAHEIYAAAQTAPGEGIEDAAARIEDLLAAQQPKPRDAIARSKRILGLVDSYHENPTQHTRTALRVALMDEFQSEPGAAVALPCPICGGEAIGHIDLLERVTIAPEPRAEVTDDDFAKLKRFAGLVLKDHRNGGYPGDVDGDVIQGYAENCGLIEERQMSEPCSEGCSCADSNEFPTVCYFNTDLGKAVIDAARTGGAS